MRTIRLALSSLPLLALGVVATPAGAADATGRVDPVDAPVARRAAAYEMFLESRAAMAIGNLDGARDRLERIIELDPAAATPRAQLARLCLETGDLKCAASAARAAVDRDPTEVSARKVLAQLSLRAWRAGRDEARLTEALGHLEAATDARPEDTGSWISRIRLLASIGRVAEAEKVAARAAATPGIDPAMPYIALVRLLVAGGKRDEAIGVLSRSEVRGRAAVPLLEMLADLYNARGDLAGQERALTRLFELRSADFSLARQLGRTRLELGDPFGALAPLRTAVHLRPTDPDASLDLARALVGLGRGAGAEALIASLPRAYQVRPPVMHLWARAAEQAGRDDAAAERLGALIDSLDGERRNDLEPSLRFRQAEAWLRAGRPDRALEALSGLESDPAVERLRIRAIELRDGRSAADEALAPRLRDEPPAAGYAALALERELALAGAKATLRRAAAWIGAAARPSRYATEMAGWLAAW